MFGYVRPRRDALSQADSDVYYEAYCGLCRAMGREFGFRTRFLVNYDMTFLYLLRASLKPPVQRKKCWCPAKMCGRKSCLCDEEGYRKVAAYNVILCYHKLLDNIRDGGFFRRLGCRIAKAGLRRPYRKAAKMLPEFRGLTVSELEKLQRLEQARSASIDATADTFARIIAGCVSDYQDSALRRPAETLLYQIGRYIYLCDALDDLKQDLKDGSYNPLIYRFRPKDGGLQPEDLEYFSQLMDSSVNLAGSALLLLPMKTHGALLENIVFLGLPTVVAAVKAGKFHAKTKDHPRKERNK